MPVIILIILFIVGFVLFLKYLDRKSRDLSDSLLAQGLISSEFLEDALRRSFSGVLFSAKEGNLNNIFNRLDRSTLISYKIYPTLDMPAGMILFDSYLLTNAYLRYVETKDGLTIFEFKMHRNVNVQGRGGITTELGCNMILTFIKKAME